MDSFASLFVFCCFVENIVIILKQLVVERGDSMFCQNCGKEVPEGENNCPSCGVSLNSQNEVKYINNEPSDNKVENEEKSNNKKADILTLIAAALLLVPILLLNYLGNSLVLGIITLVMMILGITILVYARIKYPSNETSAWFLRLVIALSIVSIITMWMCNSCSKSCVKGGYGCYKINVSCADGLKDCPG